jgi:engulfment/cell motility protein 1
MLLANYSLGLINAALRSAEYHASPSYPALISLMEHLALRRYVSVSLDPQITADAQRLMHTNSTNAVEPHIFNYQARWTSILQRKRLTSVRPSRNPVHQKMLAEIWEIAGLGRGIRDLDTWRRLGLGDGSEVDRGEGETGLFRDVGELGLQCLVSLLEVYRADGLALVCCARGEFCECMIRRVSLS